MESLHTQVELLAPAGSFQGFLGAVNGGADAVYLAGNRFGARAFADNFTEEEIKEALFIAKLFGVKVYLTVNTLLKNMEMNELYDYIKPLYEQGLTGVIIQDFGVFTFLKEHFPGLELHASTQMTVTSVEGALFLKEQGAKRVVLSRELTLKEVKEIVDAGVETECFIHGSMCYCYSGQCLFSSLIGGRSGNRGRCAQPCRLPYKVGDKNKDTYCFSLKDMCTLEHLPELIDSGIASFKIEGRMKNPAYAAWVTRIYRKYIDSYLANPDKPYKVDVKDLEQLKTLYIRTALQDGYYHKYRGKDMITKDSPAYSKTDEAFVVRITEEMIQKKPQKAIKGEAIFTVGEVCRMKVWAEIDGVVTEAEVYGDVVQEAIKAPMTADAIKERLSKTGDSYFVMEEFTVQTSGNVFMPVKAVNELRRKALETLENQIKASIKRKAYPEMSGTDTENGCNDSVTDKYKTDSKPAKKEAVFIAFAETVEQYDALLKEKYIKRVVVPYTWLLDDALKEKLSACIQSGKELFFRLPDICRNESFAKISEALEISRRLDLGDGFYVNQTDSLAWIRKNAEGKDIIGDIHLYAANNVSVDWLDAFTDGFTVSVELNKDELRHMNLNDGEMIIYGRTPLMHTANCVFLTDGECQRNGKKRVGVLRDRTGAIMPFRTHCDEAVCYNTVYNSVATSLHKHMNVLGQLGAKAFQLRFTVENKAETEKVLAIYRNISEGRMPDEVPFKYTNGHFLRGVQ